MRCIAVNVLDAKKEIIRLDLKSPIKGSDGPRQIGTYLDCDTNKEVKEVTLKRRGIYEVSQILVARPGKSGPIGKETGFEAGTVARLKQEVTQEDSCCLYQRELVYAFRDNTVWKCKPFYHMDPADTVQFYYITFRFLDE